MVLVYKYRHPIKGYKLPWQIHRKLSIAGRWNRGIGLVPWRNPYFSCIFFAFSSWIISDYCIAKVNGSSTFFTAKAEVKFCTKFNRRRDFSLDYWTKPWLWNADNVAFYKMYPVIVHILLLFIRHDDGKVQTDFFVCHCIFAAHELIQIPDVPYNVTKLPAEYLTDFLGAVLFTFGKCKIVFSGAPTVIVIIVPTIIFDKRL